MLVNKLVVALVLFSLALIPSQAADLKEIKLTLSKNSSAVIYFEEKYQAQANYLNKELPSLYDILNKIFAYSKPLKTEYVIINKTEFIKKTNLPNWISAIYHEQRIFIPVSSTKLVNPDKLWRSLKHEYCHAFIAKITAGKLPYWLDEGIALWIEGLLHPNYEILLAEYLENNQPLDLVNYKDSFATLESKSAKIAYAQSRFFVNRLVNDYGLLSFRDFLYLTSKINYEQAFNKIYNISINTFQKKVFRDLIIWKKEYKQKSFKQFNN